MTVYRRCRRCKTLFSDEELKRDEKGRLICPKCGFFLFNLVNLGPRSKEKRVTPVKTEKPRSHIIVESIDQVLKNPEKTVPSSKGAFIKTILADLEVDWKPLLPSKKGRGEGLEKSS